jgi:hypothetical protein
MAVHDRATVMVFVGFMAAIAMWAPGALSLSPRALLMGRQLSDSSTSENAPEVYVGEYGGSPGGGGAYGSSPGRGAYGSDRGTGAYGGSYEGSRDPRTGNPRSDTREPDGSVVDSSFPSGDAGSADGLTGQGAQPNCAIDACAAIYERCAGGAMEGAVCCVEGTTCVKKNEWYAACLTPERKRRNVAQDGWRGTDVLCGDMTSVRRSDPDRTRA